jgi:tyrosyl-tRNA synthetase
MDSESRFELITKNTEEVLTSEDLKDMIQKGIPLKHYIGFEISGKVHLGTGLMTGLKIADLQKAKVDCSCYLATWHAWINNKLGGDLDVIRKSADYFKEGLKAGIEVMGGDPDNVKFVNGDELYHNNDDFWLTVIEIGKNTSLARAMRSVTIMGRKEGDNLPLASLFYTPMQVADIFAQSVNIAHAGMDQRKAQVIAREVALKLGVKPLVHNKEKYKPVALHHHLILGLQKPSIWPVPQDKMQELWSEMKMSKSVQGSAVYIHDSPEEIMKKMNDAFCPAKEAMFNPVLDWTKWLIFSREKISLDIVRPEKFGGNLTYHSYADVEKDFVEGKLHPMDLKKAVGEYLVNFLEPARKRFEKPAIKKLKEEIEKVTITR